jgi:hypothetical protein
MRSGRSVPRALGFLWCSSTLGFGSLWRSARVHSASAALGFVWLFVAVGFHRAPGRSGSFGFLEANAFDPPQRPPGARDRSHSARARRVHTAHDTSSDPGGTDALRSGGNRRPQIRGEQTPSLHDDRNFGQDVSSGRHLLSLIRRITLRSHAPRNRRGGVVAGLVKRVSCATEQDCLTCGMDRNYPA